VRGTSVTEDLHAGATASTELVPGALIAHFQVMRVLGRGGMGDVVLARDTRLGRRVALKFLHRANADAHLLHEAQAAARLAHPHIVAVYSVGAHAGRPYLEMEYVDGPSLRARLRQERFTAPEALRTVRAIASALAEAHSRGVLHLDLKPENVMLARDGRVRVIDFGLAALVGPEDAGDGAAVQGGTPAYMAPEQWRGGQVGEAADVWALGIILHEALCGQHPVPAEARAKLYEIVTSGRPFAPPDGVDEPVAELVTACLAPEASLRPSAAEVALRLDRLVEAGARMGSEESPFRGLHAFDERHAGSFHGRDAEIGALLELLRDEPLLPVVGPSGAGKSSFIRAGLFPRLRERGWHVIALRPGERPFAALASALGTGADDLETTPGALALALRRLAAERRARVLVFVDQLEEVFTLVEDAAVRARFVTALFGAADDVSDPVRVCYAVRDDFFARFAEVTTAVGRVTLLQSPAPDALRDIVTRPLAAVGYAFDDPTLAGEIVDAIAGAPGGLPLLQFALRQLWERRDPVRRLLLRAAYDAMGGVSGALAVHADGVLHELLPEETRVVRDLLLRLVTPAGTRRVLPLDRLLTGLGPQAARLLDRLVAARLLRVSRSEVELAHESLIRGWGQLTRWIDEGREELVFVAELGQAAEVWERRGRSDEQVWRGEALRQAEAAIARLAPQLDEGGAVFLAASRRLAYRAARRRTLLRAASILVLGSVALAATLVAAAIDASRRTARHERDLAETQRADAERETARAALARGDPLTARASLRTSLETRDSLNARAVLWQLDEEPLLWSRSLPLVAALAYGSDGTTLAVGTLPGRVVLVDTRTGAVSALADLGADGVSALAFAPSGAMLAVAGHTGQITLIDQPSGAMRPLGSVSGDAQRLVFSPDGALLAVADDYGAARLWDTRSGASRAFDERPGVADALAFSPDGAQLATGGADAIVTLRRTSDGVVLRSWPNDGQRVVSLAFHPRRSVLAVAGQDGAVRLIDLTDGTRGAPQPRHYQRIRALRYSPDGRWLASEDVRDGVTLVTPADADQPRLRLPGGGDGRALEFAPDSASVATASDDGVRLWRTGVGRRPESPFGPEVGALAFFPDGQRLLAGLGARLVVLDVATGRPTATHLGHSGEVRDLEIDRRGEVAASASMDGSLRIWDLVTGQPTRVFLHPLPTLSASLTSDATRVASGVADGQVGVWDLTTGARQRAFAAHSAWSVARISPDGRFLATASYVEPTIKLWDAASGQPLRTLVGHTAGVKALAFSPDGARLASGGDDREVRLWDVRTGAGHLLGRHEGYVIHAAFDAAGTRLLSTSSDRTARVWDLATGAQQVLPGHRGDVNTAAFSADGALTATGSDDGTVRLWREGQPVWRTVALVSSAPELLSHRGWEALSGVSASAPPPESWRRALAGAQRGVESVPAGRVCLLTRDGTLEAWDESSDRRVWARPVSAGADLAALGTGCAVRADAHVQLFLDGDHPAVELAADATALSSERDELFVARQRELAVIAPDGALRARVPVGCPATAGTRLGAGFAVGCADGSLEVLDEPPGSRKTVTLHGVAVSRLAAGPTGTVFAGFEDGTVLAVATMTGTTLARWRLHGAITDLQVDEHGLRVASETGDALGANLGVLGAPICDVLREVWRTTPVIAVDGEITLRAPPGEHACAR
jgi:WD40 repeat protein